MTGLVLHFGQITQSLVVPSGQAKTADVSAADASRSLSNHCQIFTRLMQLVMLTFSTRFSAR